MLHSRVLFCLFSLFLSFIFYTPDGAFAQLLNPYSIGNDISQPSFEKGIISPLVPFTTTALPALQEFRLESAEGKSDSGTCQVDVKPGDSRDLLEKLNGNYSAPLVILQK